MIVEFFGVPGGGKTKLLRRLTKDIPDAKEAIAKSHRDIIIGTLMFACKHPMSFVVWICELGLYANGLFRYKAGLLLRSMAARSIAEKNDKGGLVFIDEGLLQRMLTIFDKPLTSRHIKFLLRTTTLPSFVIYVHGGAFGRFTTAHNRLNSPRARNGEAALKQWIHDVEINARNIQSVLSDSIKVIKCAHGQPDSDPSILRERIVHHVSVVQSHIL